MRIARAALAAVLLLLTACSAPDAAAPLLPPPLLPASGGSPSAVTGRSAELDGHTLVAENPHFELYLDEAALGLIIRDKESGAVMRSTVSEPNAADNDTWKGFYQSGVVLQYIRGTNLNMTQADFINTEHSKTLYYREDGFTADVTFPSAGISYTLTVTLTDTGFTAEIPQSSIREENPENTVGAFYVYPFLGYSTLGADEGYMLIPDGQGALIELQDNERRFSSPFISYIYGDNVGLNVTNTFFRELVPPENILMPVYGMVHTAKNIGFLGIVESGAENAVIEAWPNGASTQFDWIAARFMYRHVFMQPTGQTSGTVQTRTERPNRVDIKIRFAFAAGNAADYCGLALRYREYLAETGAFASAAADPFRTQVDFFGQEKKNWALFKLDVNMTKFDEAADILRLLSDSGVGAPLVVYSGWQSGGYTAGAPNAGFSPAAGLGGSGGFSRLAKTAEEQGVLLLLQNDLLYVNPVSHPFIAMDSLKRITGRTTEIPLGGPVYSTMRYLSPFASLGRSEKAAARLEKSGAYGVSLTGTTSFLTAFKDGHYYDRADCAALYRALTERFARSFPLALDRAFANQWQFASFLVNMPTGGSSYVYTSQEIPFLSIALSGQIPVYAEYTNFQANQRKFFLQLVESGMRPSFLITAQNPSLLQNTNRSDIYS
ncbi:MAG: DUF5696 domain-containing protein, partial [Oscillospiraceae bacterium]|nr:DUF5696 domain-containing protein [Oscillospiraceae bacterium]